MRKLFQAAALTFVLAPSMILAQDLLAFVRAIQSGDYETAFKELQPLAAQGNAIAQYNLGVMYGDGMGVPQDYAEAMKWFRLAAAQGDASAQYNLGVMYEDGQGGPQDKQTAQMWLNTASANGSEQAGKWRDELAAEMTLLDISEAQRRARACMASSYQDCD